MAFKSGFSLWYEFARIWIRSGVYTFYKRVEVENYESVPRKKAVIFIANHQNAFLDAIVIPSHRKAYHNVNFLVRADIFKNKIAAKAMASLKLMPIYRQRDGVDSLEKNEAIFNQCYKYLKNKQTILLFPEGNHNNKKTLRPTRKGTGRIAFGAEEKFDFKLDVHVVAVGIDYSNHTDFGGTLYINFGDPIRLADYKQEYEENAPKVLNTFKEDLENRLRPLMIDIQVKEVYDLLESLREIYIPQQLEKEGKKRISLRDGFKINKKLIEKVEAHYSSNQQEVETLDEHVKTYNRKLKKNNFRSYLFEKKGFSTRTLLQNSLFLLLTFPIFLVGFLSNIIPFYLPHYLVKKTVRDKHFHSSIKVFGGMVMFLLWFLAILIVNLLMLDPWWMAFCVLAGIVFSGIFALRWWRLLQKTKAKFRYNSFTKKKKKEAREMSDLLKDIIASTDGIMNA